MFEFFKIINRFYTIYMISCLLNLKPLSQLQQFIKMLLKFERLNIAALFQSKWKLDWWNSRDLLLLYLNVSTKNGRVDIVLIQSHSELRNEHVSCWPCQCQLSENLKEKLCSKVVAELPQSRKYQRNSNSKYCNVSTMRFTCLVE